MDEVLEIKGFSSWSDLVLFYGLLLFFAYVVFIISQHFARTYYGGFGYRQRILHHAVAVIVSAFVALLFLGGGSEGTQLSKPKKLNAALDCFLFVGAFSAMGVLSGHRRH